MACIKTTFLCVIFLAVYAKFYQVEAFDECQFDYECKRESSYRKYCCKRKYPEYHKCASDCLFDSCVRDSDCAPGECCNSNDVCRSVCDVDLAGWIIAVIVISVLVVIGIPVAIVVFCCCCAAAASRRPVHGGVIVAQPTTTGTTAVFTTQNQQQYPPPGQPMYPPQPYPDQPPAYQPPAYQPHAYPPMAMPQSTEVKH